MDITRMKKLIIIGAGSVGGFIAYNHDHLIKDYQLIGFLDDDETKSNKQLFGYPVLGTTGQVDKYLDCVFILGIAFPKIKKKIVDRLQKFNLSYINYISPDAWISKGVEIGKGVIIYPGACINYETTIGDYVTVNMNAVVGHNCKLERYSTLAPGVCLAGHTKCEEGVDLGINSATRQNSTIGKFAAVGGQAMVIRDVKDNSIVIGVPAKNK